MKTGRKRKDLVGKRFGEVLVIEDLKTSPRTFKIKCDCGNIEDKNYFSKTLVL